jgi:uncharacterized damage-inducible protein DinB
MAFEAADLIDGIRKSRKQFLRHLKGMREEQWDWKPYPECKNVRETLAHLIGVDRCARASIETGEMPDFRELEEPERDRAKLLGLLDESHWDLIFLLEKKFSSTPLDEEIRIFGDTKKLGSALAYLTSEDYYHSGQVAFIRMATDPSWDYYKAVYGEE